MSDSEPTGTPPTDSASTGHASAGDGAGGAPPGGVATDGDQPSAAAGRKRSRLQWPVVLWLVIVWVLLFGDLSVANVLSGLAVALFAILLFPLPPIVFTGRLRPGGLLRAAGRFLGDMVVASLGVVRQTLNLRHQPTNAIIAVPLRSRSDLYLTLTAEALSLIPGSVVVEVDRWNWVVYVHVLGADDEESVARARETALAQEERIVLALASDEELAAFHRARTEPAPTEGQP